MFQRFQTSRTLKKLQYVKAVQVLAERGSVKYCQLCTKEFNMILVKEHQCKRCKRAVCDSCSPHKAVVQKYEDGKGHRQCNFCKLESEHMKKFILDNSIVFMQDTLAVKWVQVFDINLENVVNDYKQAQQDSISSGDQTEIKKMKSQLNYVLQEIEDWQNYSLREFFHQIVDQTKANAAIDRILTSFLLKYPQVGWSPDLAFITYFLLCFGSEGVVFQLLSVIYGSIIPPYLYNTALELQKYDFGNEIDLIMTIMINGLGIKSVEAISIKQFLLNSLPLYIQTLSINFFLFETTFFVIDQMFLGGKDAYGELIKCLASVISLQCVEIKKFDSKYDEAEINILKHVRLDQSLGAYVKTKKVNTEKLKQFQNNNTPIQSRSVSLAFKKDLALQNEKDGQKNEVQTLKKKNEILSSFHSNQSNDLIESKNQTKILQEKVKIMEDELMKYKEEVDILFQDNQILKVDKFKQDSLLQSQQTLDNSALMSSQIELINDQSAQLSVSLVLLQDEKKKNFAALEEIEIQRNIVIKIRDRSDDMEKLLIQNDITIQKQKQDIELMNLKNSSQGREDKTAKEDQYNQILKEKNDQINSLVIELREQDQKKVKLQNELEQSLLLQERQETKINNQSSEFNSLELEFLNYKSGESERRVSITQPRASSQTGISMAVIMKDLEDGKNLLQKKNAEILILKKLQKDKDDQIDQLSFQVVISQNVTKNFRENEYSSTTIQNAAEDSQELKLLQDDLVLFLSDENIIKRTAAQNLKIKIESIEKELIFRQTESQIKREQLTNLKEKFQSLEISNVEANKQKVELEQKSNLQCDQIVELQKQIDVLYEKLSINQDKVDSSMIKPRNNYNEKDILKENSQGCVKDNNCQIF